MKYLFCTDGSKISLCALDKALALAKKGAVVDIIHVIHQNFLLEKIHPDKDFDKKYKKILNKIVEKSQKIIKKHAHCEGQRFFEHGNNNKIIEHLEQNAYDLVIAGSHGYKGIQNQIGSTSRKVAERSPYPVFIARPEANDSLDRKHKKFLLCVDQSIQSFNAISSFVELFDTKDSEISILTVSADVTQYPIEIASDSTWIKACLEAENKTAKEVLAKSEDIINKFGLKVVNKIHLEGDISSEILSYVNKNFQNLLILGSSAKQGLASFLLGSISKRILDYSASSILIIPIKR